MVFSQSVMAVQCCVEEAPQPCLSKAGKNKADTKHSLEVSIKNDKVVVLIGKRGTGKSFLVKDLLYYHTDIPIGTVVSGTESANKFYGDFVPNAFIHEEVSGELMQNVITRQKLVMKKEFPRSL